jgi:hypothetical protein
MSENLLGALPILALSLIIVALILLSRLDSRLKSLLVIGLILRLVGSQLYYYLSTAVYGFGDFSIYYFAGQAWGDALLEGTVDQLRSPYLTNWCCTGFTVRLTGLLLILIGPSFNGAFLLFSIVGYGGIVALAIAFSRALPDAPYHRYLAWIVFFPSLWYWPAALGKDALILAGVGLAVLGFVGRRRRTGWLCLSAGLAAIFVIRPQVAVVVIVAMGLAFWMSGEFSWNTKRVFQGLTLVAAGIVITVLASDSLGVQIYSVEEVTEYLDSRSTANSYGGSAVEAGGLLGIINVLFRPFIWEGGGLVSVLAASEITALWAFALWRRREIVAFFRDNRKNRLILFSLIFIVLYVVLTGMALGNLGLIARQRVHVFPFLLMFFAGISLVRRRTRHHRMPPAGVPA